MHRRAFSMIELVVVIVILGVIATIAVPRMSNAAEKARTNTLSAQLAQYTRAFETYHAENLAWPPESATGTAPSVMTGYLDPDAFARETVVGGYWDWQNNGGNDVEVRIVGIRASATASAVAVDSNLDTDGNLGTGRVTLDGGVFSIGIGR